MCPLELPNMNEKLPENWERADTEMGLPYYVDHRDKKTYWDHPLFVNVAELIKSCDSVKYSAYRTAAKIRILQKRLHFDHVRLSVVAGVFEQHGLSAKENTSSLECGHLEAILSDIFFVAKAETQVMNDKEFDQNIATELALNLLLNTFDLKRRGSIKVIEVKVVLAILSCGLVDPTTFVHRPVVLKGHEKLAQNRLMECYRFLFLQASGGNGKPANRVSLSNLFYALSTFIGIFLKEWRAFGMQFVPGTLHSCMEQGNDQVVSEGNFLKWLDSGPRLLIWVTTLHRMIAAESVKHEGVRCILCKASPIVGLRFRCLSCLMHDQCQECFLHGKTNGKHKLGHPMYEYCLPTTSRENRQALVKTLKNKVKSSHLRLIHPRRRHEGSMWERRSVTYVDNEQNGSVEGDDMGDTQLLLQEIEMMTGENPAGKSNEKSDGHQVMPLPPRYPKEELSSIIGHLEEGHRDLGDQIEGLCVKERAGRVGGPGLLGLGCIWGSGEESAVVEEQVCRQLRGTREHLEQQVKRLKALQECLQKIQPYLGTAVVNRHCHLESTPMPINSRGVSVTRLLPRVDDLSPILASRSSSEMNGTHEVLSGDSLSVGAVLSGCKGDPESWSRVGGGVASELLLSPPISMLTDISPGDLSTILMARWRGGMKGFLGSSPVQSPRFPSSSILPSSPVNPVSQSYLRDSKEWKLIREEVPSPLAEIQRDLDWVLGELDTMLLSQISDHSSSANSEGDSNSPHRDGESLENQKICKAVTQMEDIIAGLIKIVEKQKSCSEDGPTSVEPPTA